MQKKEYFFKQFVKKAFAVTLSASLVFGMDQIPSIALVTAQAENIRGITNSRQNVEQSSDQTSDQSAELQDIQFVQGKAVTLTEGETVQLQYVTFPQNVEVGKAEWKSDADAVAHVDENGQVTALCPGKANITVTISGKTASCVITVEKQKISVTGISIKPKQKEIQVGDTLQINAQVLPENADNKNIIWKLDEKSEKYASISQDGLVTAKAEGIAVVIAETEDGSFMDVCQVKVKEKEQDLIELKELKFAETEKEILTHQKFQLVPQYTPINATNKEVIWTSENPEVATVENGEVITLTPGITKITATSSDGIHQAVCTLTVKAPVISVKAIGIDESSVVLDKGKSFNLKAYVYPEDASNKSVTFKVSKNGIVKISKKNEAKATATIKAVSAGSVVVTVTSKANKKVTKKILITVKPDKVTGIASTQVKKTSAKISWKKCKGVAGYEVNVVNKKTGDVILDKIVSKTSYAVKKLKKSTAYKVNVRAYIKVSGKKVFGNWSATKVVLTKKK